MTPAISAQVFHMHRFIHTPIARNRTFYIHRDGRDVVISSYFAFLRSPWDDRPRQRFEAYVGERMEENAIRGQLPAFIDWYFKHDTTSSIRWRKHILESLKYPYVRLSYENLRNDPFAELGRAIMEMTTDRIYEGRLRRAIANNNFDLKKNRANAYFLRSGRTGDWKRYFSRASAERFNSYALDALVRLGYERDERWVEELYDA